MFTNILLASDGSECALKAAAVAATLAREFTARLTIINVFQPTPTIGPYGETVNIKLNEKYVPNLREHAVSPVGHIREEMGVSYQSRKEAGQPAAESVCVAEPVQGRNTRERKIRWYTNRKTRLTHRSTTTFSKSCTGTRTSMRPRWAFRSVTAS